MKHRIDTIIEKGFTILIGDANGADRAVQRFVAEKGYRNVIVHCMAGNCRNNVGGWPTREIVAPEGARGFAYYSTKDQAMVDDASHGLMLWDGKSKGTLIKVPLSWPMYGAAISMAKYKRCTASFSCSFS